LTNLLELLENVTEYVDQGSPGDMIYLDFQTAFDKVPHHSMLKKSSSTRNRWNGLRMDRGLVEK
jgi:hypothetical protein